MGQSIQVEQPAREHEERQVETNTHTQKQRVMVNPGMAINMAVSGFGFYGMLGLAVPQFCYKLLFRGGGKAGWPGSKKNENLPEDGDVVHEQALRWMGFVVSRVARGPPTQPQGSKIALL